MDMLSSIIETRPTSWDTLTNCCFHGTFLHFSLQGFRTSIQAAIFPPEDAQGIQELSVARLLSKYTSCMPLGQGHRKVWHPLQHFRDNG